MSSHPVPATTPVPTPKQYYASISGKPGDPLPEDFVVAVKNLEAAIKAPIWLLIQNGEMSIDGSVYAGFRDARLDIEENRPVALPGGIAWWTC